MKARLDKIPVVKPLDTEALAEALGLSLEQRKKLNELKYRYDHRRDKTKVQ